MSIHVTARATARPGLEPQIQATLMDLARQTRLEPGCQSYDIHVAAGEHGDFLTYETWESEAALQAHYAQPYVQALLARADEFFSTAVEIKAWQRLG